MTHTATGAYEALQDALTMQRCVVLDGGVTTELPHRLGQEQEGLWGIEALTSSPAAVLDVHRRYLEAGADVITTNTWGLATALRRGSEVLNERGRPIHWMEAARRGIRLARAAIGEQGGEGRCAVAFSLNGDLESAEGAETVPLIARAFADGPPDLILFETLSVLSPSLYDVVEALVGTGIPVWLSFRRCRHGLCGVYGQHWGGPEGDAFGRAARRFEELGAQALLVNCVPPDHVDGMIPYLRDFTDLPLGVYPNLGYHTNAGWRSETRITGQRYGELALRWREEGAQIIGGCCGTGPEHIMAAHTALAGTLPGRERREEPGHADVSPLQPATPHAPWTSRRGRTLHPVPFPSITTVRGVPSTIPGSLLMWRHLFEEGIGARQRCLDIGCGAGLQTVQLALNGAEHVHALDIDEEAVSATLNNAFRNGVAERVSGEREDLYPWIPGERYEVIVANLPQVPVDPLEQLSSHRPADFWGRGLVDQVIAKLPLALAAEGFALVTATSLLSQLETSELLAQHGLRGEVVAWEVVGMGADYRVHREQLEHVEALSDAYRLQAGDEELLVCHVLEIRHADAVDERQAPWRP